MSLRDPELNATPALGRARLPDTGALQTFVMVAHCGSMRAAAIDMGTSATAVRRAIARLERHTEGRLFVRTRSGVRLTPLGRSQLVNAQRAVYVIGEAFGRAATRPRVTLTKRTMAGYC